MKKGAMMVGQDGQTLGRDMRAMPRIVGCFIAAPSLLVWRQIRRAASA